MRRVLDYPFSIFLFCDRSVQVAQEKPGGAPQGGLVAVVGVYVPPFTATAGAESWRSASWAPHWGQGISLSGTELEDTNSSNKLPQRRQR